MAEIKTNNKTVRNIPDKDLHTHTPPKHSPDHHFLHRSFDENHVLRELKHYLPSQTPLKDFIHHNSLHAFQNLKFYDAIFKASKIFGYQVTLQLTEYRELYKIGRIKNDVLERIVAGKKGPESLVKWKENLLLKEYDISNFPRIGSLRAHLNLEKIGNPCAAK